MGTIEQKVDYLKETKQLIKQSIKNKGVSVSDSDTFRSYAAKIDSISGSIGEVGTVWYVGDFYDGKTYEGNNGDLFLNTGQTDRGLVLQFQDGTWNPVGSILGPQGENGIDGTDGSIAPVGSIVIWGSEDIPENYLKCEGQILSREEYASLFNVIGTTFGDGDGTTTFALPDMRNYVVVGMSDDTDINAIGKKYGEKNHVLTLEEQPTLEGSLQSRQSNDNNILDTYPTQTVSGPFTYVKNGGERWNNQITGWGTSNSNNARIDFNNGGTNTPHNNMQPSMAMVFIIKAYEIIPADVNVVDSLDGNSTTDAPSVHAVNSKINSLVGDIDTWHEITELTSDFKIYEGAGPIQYRKVGNVVEVCGVLAPVGTLPGSTSAVVMFTLPEGYRPNINRYFVCQGSGTNKWVLTVYPSGSVGFSRYGVTETIDCTSDRWLPFNVMFMAD